MNEIPCSRCGKPVAQRLPNGHVSVTVDKVRTVIEVTGSTTCGHLVFTGKSFIDRAGVLRRCFNVCGQENRLEAVREPAGAA